MHCFHVTANPRRNRPTLHPSFAALIIILYQKQLALALLRDRFQNIQVEDNATPYSQALDESKGHNTAVIGSATNI